MSSAPSSAEVSDALLARALGSADAARARAQGGFTIASAIATALIAAGVFSNITDRAKPARWVGGTALLLWLAAMVVFLAAVVVGARRQRGGAGAGSHADLAESVLADVNEERLLVLRYTRAAALIVFLAVGVTAATVLVGFTSLSTDRDAGTLLVTAQGRSLISRVCPEPLRMHGFVDVPTLRRDYVTFRVEPGGCRPGRVTPLRIARSEVLGFEEDSST